MITENWRPKEDEALVHQRLERLPNIFKAFSKVDFQAGNIDEDGF